jgi:hypothetical protein
MMRVGEERRFGEGPARTARTRGRMDAPGGHVSPSWAAISGKPHLAGPSLFAHARAVLA